MLRNIPPLLSPDLLSLLARMGHGDELVLADGNFPAEALAKRLVRADGHPLLPLLEAVLIVMPLDTFVEHPAAVMQIVGEPDRRAPSWSDFQRLIDRAEGRSVPIARIERFTFYERARNAFGIVATGETALYANLILKKGVVEP